MKDSTLERMAEKSGVSDNCVAGTSVFWAPNVEVILRKYKSDGRMGGIKMGGSRGPTLLSE